MKNILKLTILVFVLLTSTVYSQEKKVLWDYPVKPGSEEWKSLSSHDKMLKVCQIPDEILKTMTTKDLVIVCLNYPLQFDFYAYDNLLEGIKNVAANFNGLEELLARRDNAQHLFEMLKLKNAEVASIIESKEATILQRGELIVKQALTEMLLSHEAVVENTAYEQQKEIASVAMNNITSKEQMPQLYSMYSIEASAYLLCANLKKIKGNLSSDSESFFDTGMLKKDILDELKQNYFKLLNE
jgi:hypothetical protein